MFIKEVEAREIEDSRGEKTIEVRVNDCVASSPSGKSTGKYEAHPYHKSLKWNVDFLNDWKKWIEIEGFSDLERVEEFIKKELKSARDFGGNALFAFESAILKSLAKEQNKELWQTINPKAKRFPVPVGNAVGGGLHSSGQKNHPVFQEFLIIPRERSFSDNVGSMKEAYISIGRILKATETNDEGAWHVEKSDGEILDTLDKFESSFYIGVDVAASSFYKNKLYDYGKINKTNTAQVEHMIKIAKNYDLFYLEDPVEENDFKGFAEIKKKVKDCLIAGDDLTATHLDRLEKAIKEKAINAMIIKPNQNGSLLEVKKIIELCKKHSIKTIMSHRSGETLDNALADYAFAFQVDYIKCGIATKWREAKLERMIEIEKSLR